MKKGRLCPSKHFGSVIVFLTCLIGEIPIESFAQPLARSKSKFVGNIIGSSIRSDFANYWNQVTPENAGKWGSVEASRDSYNWNDLDLAYSYAHSRGFPFRFHVLIWGKQQPGWIANLDSADQIEEIEEWIRLAGERYPDADYVEVVNEPIEYPPYDYYPVYRDAMGGAGETGWDWVIWAFEKARQYFPNSKLLLNDYNILSNQKSIDTYLEIVQLLKERDLIDGIAEQAHYFAISYLSPSTMRNNLDRMASAGLPIQITEFDINEPNDSTQLAKYKTIFPTLYEHPGVKGITLWGYVQNQIWQANAYLLTARSVERPAMQWLRTYLAIPLRPQLVSPVGTTGEPRNPLLVWQRSDSGSTYRVEVATNAAFSSVVVDSTTADTLLRLSPLATNTKYYWHVDASNDSGTSAYSVTASFTTGNQIVELAQPGGIPTEFALSQNYPNPFNPTTQINYSIPEKGYVSLKVYNLLGQEAATLFDGVRQPGNYVVTFDGTGLPSGVYLYRLMAGDFAETRKLVLVR